MELLIEDLMTQLVEGVAVTCISRSASPYGRFNGKLTPMREEKLSEQDCNQLIFPWSTTPNANNWSKPGNWTVPMD